VFQPVRVYIHPYKPSHKRSSDYNLWFSRSGSHIKGYELQQGESLNNIDKKWF
jgi:hypothetical protein